MKINISCRTILKNKWENSLIYKYSLSSDNILGPVMVNLTETWAFLGSQAH